MNVADIGYDGRIKATGKGSNQRVVTLGQSGLELANRYRGCRGDQGSAVWQTFEGDRLTTNGLQGVLDRIKAADVDVFTDGLDAHRFRHTAITKLLRVKVPLLSVQRYAGHSSPQTTLRNAQVIEADEAIAAVHTQFLFGEAP